MPRPCVVCCSGENIRIVAQMVAEGATDQAIADRLGMPGNTGRMRIARHRVGHIVALAKVAAKGKDVADKRRATVEAAERGDDIAAFVGLDEITRDVRKVSKRLSRAAKVTEAAGQFSVMTGVVAQQHKNLDLRGRLGGHIGFVPQKGEATAPQQFNLILNLGGVGGQTEKYSFGEAVDADFTPLIDVSPTEIPTAVEIIPSGSTVDQPVDPEAVKLGRLFGPKN
jgi:hypothetical protein